MGLILSSMQCFGFLAFLVVLFSCGTTRTTPEEGLNSWKIVYSGTIRTTPEEGLNSSETVCSGTISTTPEEGLNSWKIVYSFIFQHRLIFWSSQPDIQTYRHTHTVYRQTWPPRYRFTEIHINTNLLFHSFWNMLKILRRNLHKCSNLYHLYLFHN